MTTEAAAKGHFAVSAVVETRDAAAAKEHAQKTIASLQAPCPGADRCVDSSEIIRFASAPEIRSVELVRDIPGHNRKSRQLYAVWADGPYVHTLGTLSPPKEDVTARFQEAVMAEYERLAAL
jgi:hypothetical protein